MTKRMGWMGFCVLAAVAAIGSGCGDDAKSGDGNGGHSCRCVFVGPIRHFLAFAGSRIRHSDDRTSVSTSVSGDSGEERNGRNVCRRGEERRTFSSCSGSSTGESWYDHCGGNRWSPS